MWGWQGPLSPSSLYKLHVWFLPLFSPQHFTADGEQQASYKAAFPGEAKRHHLSLAPAAGHQQAGSQASDCSFNTCHTQHGTHERHNPLPAAFPSDPPVWLLSWPHTNNAKQLETPSEGTCPLVYVSVAHHNPTTACYAGDLLKATCTTYQRCFIRATNAPGELRGATAGRGINAQKCCDHLPQRAEQLRLAQVLTLSAWDRKGKGHTDKSPRPCQCPNCGQEHNRDSDGIASKTSVYLLVLCTQD